MHAQGQANLVKQVRDIVRQCGTYPPELEDRLVMETTELLRNFPTLSPVMGQIPRSDGRLASLLSLYGVVPISYRGATYNIPLSVFITEYHPQFSPLVYVKPTTSMAIKADHPHVSQDGMVHIPYLASWDSLRSTLIGMVQVLQSVFSQNPPVFARPSNQGSAGIAGPAAAAVGAGPHSHPQQQQQSSPQQHQQPGYPIPPTNSFASTDMSSSFPRPVPSSGSPVSDPLAARKNELQADASNKIKQALAEHREKTKVELVQLYAERKDLSSGAAVIEAGLTDLQLESDDRERRLVKLREELVLLEKWVAENVKEGPEAEDADQVMKSQDVESQQILRCMAEDFAIQDTMYALDEALDVNKIDLNFYLKELRKQAREQFFNRALLRKIKLTQAAHQRGGGSGPGGPGGPGGPAPLPNAGPVGSGYPGSGAR